MTKISLPVSALLISVVTACVPLGMLNAPQVAAPEVRQAAVLDRLVGRQWQEAAASPDSTVSEAASLAAWWRRYHDDTLNELIQLALQQAPDIAAAQARLQQVRAARALAEAALVPTLAASGSTSSRHAQAGTRHDYNAGVDVSWESSLFGGQRDLAAAARSDAEVSALQLEATRLALVAEVAREYLTLRSLQQRLQIASDNLQQLEHSVQLVAWRAQAGLASTLDVEQARSNLASSRAALPALQSGAAASRQRLALLTGQASASVGHPLGKAAALPAAGDPLAPDTPARLLERRPDVQAAQLAMNAEWQRLAARRSERWPGLTLRGSLAWQAAQLAALGGGQGALQTLAAGMSLPLFDGGRIEAGIAQQSASLQQAEVSYQRSVLTALSEVETALAEQQAARARLLARQQAAAAAARAVKLARDLYASGLVDFQQLLESERSQLSAAETLVTAQADVLLNQVQLYKVLAGGWPATDPNPNPAAADFAVTSQPISTGQP